MRKKIMIGISAVIIMAASSITAYAGQWKQDNIGYWYQDNDGSYPVNSWRWIDGNNDGIAECYYFNNNGYLSVNTVTPDGFQVDENGAWIINGLIQRKLVEIESNTFTDYNNSANIMEDTYIMNLLMEYSEYGGYADEFINYITIHKLDFINGKSFADFDDYDDYFRDFYIWADEIINFNGEVRSEYQTLWKEFQEMITHQVEILTESFNKDSEEALTLISQLMYYLSDKSRVISQLIGNFID